MWSSTPIVRVRPLARAPWITGGLSLVLLLTLSRPAASYVLVETDGGVPIHWETPCVPWWLQDGGSRDVPMEVLEPTVLEAFEAWGAIEGTSIELQMMGRTCLGRSGPTGWPGPHNVLMWHDEDGPWPYSTKVIALSSVTYDGETGLIVDTDIEMNGERYRFGTTGQRDDIDVLQAVLHELGHTLGLDHSLDQDAVMYAKGEPGEVDKRVLSQDDRAGMVASHPGARLPNQAGCEQGRGDAPAPQEVHCPASPPPPGCASGGGTTHREPSLFLVMLLSLGLWTLRRRQRLRSVSLLLPMVVVGGSAHAGAVYTTPDGVPLHWLDDAVTLTLDTNPPESIDDAKLIQSFEWGFDAWNDLDCVPVSLTVSVVESCPGEIVDDGINCVVWVHSPELWRWPSHLVAITLVHYEGDTGRIVDVDMEFNGAFTTWSAQSECTDEAHDLWATVTHETGHLLGLDHSNHPQSTMNAVTFPGDCKKRTLHEDDEETVCGLYDGIPYVTPTPEPEGDPDGGVSPSGADATGDPTADTGGGIGCTGGSSGWPTWLPAVLTVGWISRCRRRQRRALSPAH